MFRKLSTQAREIVYNYPRIVLLVFGSLFFLYRFLILPGFNFNSQLWDDEIDWENDFRQKSFIEHLFYRDAPGYFVFLPRLILLACHAVPDFMFAATLRAVLIIANLLCVYSAAKLVMHRNLQSTNLLLIFCTFCSIYIADLNYLHNIAYYFFFPILYLMQKISEAGKKFSWLSLCLIIVLIAKPIVAILMLILLGYLVLKDCYSKKALWVLIIYNLFYLGAYFILPNRWQTPTNSDLSTLKPLVLNLPWVFGMVLLPIFYFGLNGFLHFLRLELLRNILGVLLYVIPLIVAIYLCTFPKVKESLKAGSTRLQMGTLLLASSYLLVYLNYDSYWIKAFPLYSLNVPQDLWLRWSSLIPILALSVLWQIGKISGSLRHVRMIFWSVILQEFMFQIAAYSWLRR